jgi:glucuronate isomerase
MATRPGPWPIDDPTAAGTGRTGRVAQPLTLHEDRLFPADARLREIARRIFATVRDLPIISPHGHTDPAWFATDAPFSDATSLLLLPDHYLYRMLYSQGVALEGLGITGPGGSAGDVDPREAWRIFARHYHLFRGTPSALWLEQVFVDLFGLKHRLSAETADDYYDHISACLQGPAFRPRALFERFNIEVLTTTESPLDTLAQHDALRRSGWPGRVLTAYRPDPVVDPEFPAFRDGIRELASLTGEDTDSWDGYLAAHRRRRDFFRRMGATSTDHGHPSAQTADLGAKQAEALFRRVTGERVTREDAEIFRAQMLTEMARMSLDDGLVMQIHPGSFRNHNETVYRQFGRDRGADIPTPTDYVRALKPLLDRYGNEARLTIIVFTLDESTYSRELAPLAGHYPALRLGPAWWFHDSPNGLMRFREQTSETAGFYNTVGFNDDTRAFLSIPARHDVARRIDAAYLARLVGEHRLAEDEALELASDLAYHLPKRAYRLG